MAVPPSSYCQFSRATTMELTLPNLQATQKFATQIAAGLQSVLGQVPFTIALSGPLGAGKTKWIRYLCEELGVPPDSVTSPTYVLLQRYRSARAIIYHLDYYRLRTVEQVWDLGIDELQEEPVLILVEWAEKFPETLPPDHLCLHFLQHSENYGQDSRSLRKVRITSAGPIAKSILASIQQPSNG